MLGKNKKGGKMMKKVCLIVLVFSMVFAWLTAYAAGPYTALDLSKTQTAYTKGQTGQVVVYGINGDTSEQVATGVTFVSSDPAVVQVDASTGAFTAKGEGFATITASCSGVSQKVFLIVYNELKGTTDFASEPDIKVVYDMNESISTPASEAYSFDSIVARPGGKSLLTKTIVNSQILTTTGARFYTKNLYTKTLKPRGIYTDAHLGVTEFWFYDDMVNGTGENSDKKNVGIFVRGAYENDLAYFLDRDGNQITKYPMGQTVGTENWTWNRALQVHIRMDRKPGYYTLNADYTNEYGAFTTTPVLRSKGWHQVLVDATKDDTYSFYIDGQLLATRTTPGYLSNAGVETVVIEYNGMSRSVQDGANHVIALDNIKFYNVTSPPAPAAAVENVQITPSNPAGALAGTALNGTYTWNGAETEGECTYKWYRSDAADSGFTAIADATAAAYTPSVADVGKYIQFEVTPIASGGAEGTPVRSNSVQVSGHTLSIVVGKGGSVACSDRTFLPNIADSITTIHNESVLLKIQPDATHQIASVKLGTGVNEQDITSLFAGTGEASITITESTTVTVAFQQKADEIPAMVQTNALQTGNYTEAGTGTQYFSTVIFTGFSQGYGYDILEAGVILTNADGTEIELKAYEVPADGKYGIRVYGPALETGETYTMCPYIKVQKSGDGQSSTQWGKAETFTVTSAV